MVLHSQSAGTPSFSDAGGSSDDPVDVATDAAVCDCKAELLTIGAVALSRVEIKACRAQPLDRQILERMADGEDAQCPARKVSAFVFRGTCELELQSPFAGMP